MFILLNNREISISKSGNQIIIHVGQAHVRHTTTVKAMINDV